MTRGVGLGLLLALTGCNAIFGLDEATERGAGGGGDGGGAGSNTSTSTGTESGGGGGGGGTCDAFLGEAEPEGDLVFRETFSDWVAGLPSDWHSSSGEVTESSDEACGGVVRLGTDSAYVSLDSTTPIPIQVGDTLVLTGLGRRVSGSAGAEIGAEVLLDETGDLLGSQIRFPTDTWTADRTVIEIDVDGSVHVDLFVNGAGAERAAEFDEIRVYRLRAE